MGMQTGGTSLTGVLRWVGWQSRALPQPGRTLSISPRRCELRDHTPDLSKMVPIWGLGPPWLCQGPLQPCGRGVWGCFHVFGSLGFFQGWGASFRGSGQWQGDLRPALTSPHTPRPAGPGGLKLWELGGTTCLSSPPSAPLFPSPHTSFPPLGGELSSLRLTLSFDLVPRKSPGLSQWLLGRNLNRGGKSRRCCH